MYPKNPWGMMFIASLREPSLSPRFDEYLLSPNCALWLLIASSYWRREMCPRFDIHETQDNVLLIFKFART